MKTLPRKEPGGFSRERNSRAGSRARPAAVRLWYSKVYDEWLTAPITPYQSCPLRHRVLCCISTHGYAWIKSQVEHKTPGYIGISTLVGFCRRCMCRPGTMPRSESKAPTHATLLCVGRSSNDHTRSRLWSDCHVGSTGRTTCTQDGIFVIQVGGWVLGLVLRGTGCIVSNASP